MAASNFSISSVGRILISRERRRCSLQELARAGWCGSSMNWIDTIKRLRMGCN